MCHQDAQVMQAIAFGLAVFPTPMCPLAVNAFYGASPLISQNVAVFPGRTVTTKQGMVGVFTLAHPITLGGIS